MLSICYNVIISVQTFIRCEILMFKWKELEKIFGSLNYIGLQL